MAQPHSPRKAPLLMTTPENAPLQGQEAAADPTGLAVEPAVTEAPVENPPYWNELQELPESVRPLVEPVFKKWDAGVGQRLQSVHSEYEPYKPLFDEWEPDALSQAVQIAQALETDPQAFVQAIMEAYKIDLGQGVADQQPVVTPEFDENGPIDPRYQALLDQQAQQDQLLQTMANAMISERQAAEQATSMQQLEQTLAQLRTEQGDFDETYVLGLIANNVEPAQAVEMFKQAVSQYAAPKVEAPVIMGQGGGYPSNQVDPAGLDDKATKDLIVQMLRAANQ